MQVELIGHSSIITRMCRFKIFTLLNNKLIGYSKYEIKN